ncbi:hypothetical protein M3Y99_00643400 [Aphelenchoides fujianensis]|nr:hypothetical protein M3Y99_00643400 [Aphelenchoides fujianensis]
MPRIRLLLVCAILPLVAAQLTPRPPAANSTATPLDAALVRAYRRGVEAGRKEGVTWGKALGELACEQTERAYDQLLWTILFSSRNFTVSLETGTLAFFLLDPDYPGRLPGQPFFNPSLSSTAQFVQDDGFREQTGSVEVQGNVWSDVVRLFDFGENATQRFGTVRMADGYVLDQPELPDGVLGLLWDPNHVAVVNAESSPVIRLFAEHPQLERYWCLWLEDASTPAN